MTNTLFSIITINFNNCIGLEKTINSVIGQTYINYEFIIIDGGSSDQFSNVIRKYASKISFWCSEKDRGIYDAQNKGIANAKGDFLVFMNSGDCFSSKDVLQNVSKYIDKKKGPKIYYGNTNLVEENGELRFLQPPQNLEIDFFYTSTLNHQSCFIQSTLFKKYGIYNLNYKIGADYDFFLNVFLNEPYAYFYINETICDYENYGISANAKFFDLIVKERKQIQENLLNSQQLKDAEQLEIKLLGRNSNIFKLIPNINRIKWLYDQFYLRWYKFIMK